MFFLFILFSLLATCSAQASEEEDSNVNTVLTPEQIEYVRAQDKEVAQVLAPKPIRGLIAAYAFFTRYQTVEVSFAKAIIEKPLSGDWNESIVIEDEHCYITTPISRQTLSLLSVDSVLPKSTVFRDSENRFIIRRHTYDLFGRNSYEEQFAYQEAPLGSVKENAIMNILPNPPALPEQQVSRCGAGDCCVTQ